MTAFLAAELASLILLGIGAGTLVGVFRQQIIRSFPPNWIQLPGKLSAIPNRDRLAFDFPDLWPFHHSLRRGAWRSVCHTVADEDFPGD